MTREPIVWDNYLIEKLSEITGIQEKTLRRHVRILVEELDIELKQPIQVRRWHFWACFQGEHREEQAKEEIEHLGKLGYKAKVYAPRPEHKTSGHVHVVVLCTKNQLWELDGYRGYVNPKISLRSRGIKNERS